MVLLDTFAYVKGELALCVAVIWRLLRGISDHVLHGCVPEVRVRGVRLADADGRLVSAAEFGSGETMAVVSRPGPPGAAAYALTLKPRDGDLIHAVFFRGRGGAHVMAIRQDVLIKGRRMCRLRGGECMSVGGLGFVVALSGKRSWKIMMLAFVLFLLALVLALVLTAIDPAGL